MDSFHSHWLPSALNLDYIFLFQSGLLSMMAIGAAALARVQPRIPWATFALYALVLILRAWINLVNVDVANSVALHVAERIAITASAVLLIEFAARASGQFAKGRFARHWAYGSTVAVGLLAVWIFGDPGFDWSICAVISVSAIWAARQLRRAQTGSVSAGAMRYVSLIAWLLPLHGLTSSVVRSVSLPSGLIVPPEWIQFAAVCSDSCLALAVYFYNATEQQQRLPRAAAKAWRLRRYVCASAIGLVVIAGWFVAHRTASRQDAAMRSEILVRTRLAAASIDGGLARELKWDETDLTRPAYRALKALMTSLRGANSDLRFALLAGAKEHRTYFLVDSEVPGSADYSPPGQFYAEADPGYVQRIADGKAFVLGPIVDRWGTWLISSVPLVTLADGSRISFELDVAAASWDAEIRSSRLPVLLITLLISVLILGFFQAQERLRQSALQITLSEQRSRSLVEGSPDCVQMFDARGLFQAVNTNGLNALGLQPADVIGKYFWEIWPAGSQPAIRHAVAQTLAGTPLTFDAEYRRPDGRLVTWRVATNPVRDENGRVCNFVGICVDLTDRKRAEEAMRAAKNAAEEATRAKSEFLAVMSHELRTPLAGVIGMLDLLGRSPPEHVRRQYTAVARDSAETLLRILDDILDMAKIEAGRLTLEVIPFRPRNEFRHLCEAARLRAETKGLDFEYVFEDDVPEVIVGDPTRLRQILGNLQNNALKFTENGKVTVRISCEQHDASNVRLMIGVQDTGIGIAEKNRARLFAKFEQGDFSTTRRYGGTGLGLSIVKALTEAMNGTIGVHSRQGEGSTFEFSAVFAVGRPSDVAEEADSGPAEAPAATQPLRILYAEDDNVNRMVADAVIGRMGHSVDFVVNGQLAIERLRKEPYDVVLMDNRMPVMDGFQATALIRSGTAGVLDPEIYICAATANVSEANRRKCRESGMNDYVEKPIAARELVEAFGRAHAAILARGLTVVGGPAGRPRSDQRPGLSEEELLASLEVAGTQGAGEFTPATVDRLRTLFWEQAPDRVTALRAAFISRDFATMGEIAHALKSAARYAGARQLADLAAEIDDVATRSNPTTLDRLLDETENEFLRIRPPAQRPATT